MGRFVMFAFAVALLSLASSVHAADAGESSGSFRKPAPSLADTEFLFHIRTGYSTPGAVGNIPFRGLGGVGFGVDYKVRPWLSVGAAFEFEAFPATDRVSLQYLLIHNDLLANVLLRSETGFYGGAAFGVGVANLSAQGMFSGQGVSWIVGPRVGFAYRFPGTGFSMGPDVSWLFYTGTTLHDRAAKFALAARDTKRIFFVASWDF